MCERRMWGEADGLRCVDESGGEHTQEPLCQCGCGLPAPVATKTSTRDGVRKGERLRYRVGHATKGRMTQPLEERYVVNGDGCWIWQGTTNQFGYGRICLNQRWIAAHRIYYERLVGPIPEGLVIDHLCRVPSCVNPAHLEPVTNAENIRRGLVAKLTPEQVAEIRRSTDERKKLAARFGVSPAAIAAIHNRTTWGDL